MFHCRYLYDRGFLKNITLQRDPRTIEFDKCNYAVDYVRGNAKNDLEKFIKNCTIDDRDFMTEMENMAVFSRVLTRMNLIERVNEVKNTVKESIHQKCHGMQI